LNSFRDETYEDRRSRDVPYGVVSHRDETYKDKTYGDVTYGNVT
jgi:hypothetical protein